MKRQASRIVTVTGGASLALGCGGLLESLPEGLVEPPPPHPDAYLSQSADGTCNLMPHIECPPPEEGTCNPPPPQPVACPPVKLASITRSEAGCTAEGQFECPPAWSCSAAAPQPTDCPADLAVGEQIVHSFPYGCRIVAPAAEQRVARCPPALEQPLAPGYTVKPGPNGNCMAYPPPMECPEGLMCNPPPIEEIPCP